MRPRSRRGIALVLVMTVILALAIIGTPFVLSMLLQEKSGVVARYEAGADYGTRGATNYAVSRLWRGVDPLERRSPIGHNNSYTFDTPRELELPLTESLLPRESVLNPRGAIWGVNVQDEQGKINVRTAPVSVMTKLRALVDARVVSLKDYHTLFSGRDATWIVPQRVRAAGGRSSGTGTGSLPPGLHVDNPAHYGQGAKLRLTKPGAAPLEVRVTAHPITGVQGIQTEPEVLATYVDGVVELEARHPVNPNSARREALVVLFEGLELHNLPASRVRQAEAAQIASGLAGREVQRLEEFLVYLAGLPLSNEQRAAVAVNAVNPCAAILRGTGTLPLCFKSYDVYTLEALSSMNNAAGAEVAGRGFREVVSVSPPVLLRRYVESQYDFESMYSNSIGALQDPGFEGFPYGNRIISFPNLLYVPPPPAGDSADPDGVPPPAPSAPLTPPQPSDITLKPQQTPGPDGNEAYIQLRPSRDHRGDCPPEYKRALQGRQHFDDTHEGKRLRGAEETYPWERVFAPTPIQADMPSQRLPTIAEGGIEFWVRFDRIGNPVPLFDLREDEWINRVTLVVENGELVFTACDGTLGVPTNAIDNGAAEVRMPFAAQPNTWYHIAAYWKGNHWGGLALLVDGFAHPEQKFRHVNPEGTEVFTKLSVALDDMSSSVAIGDDSFLPSTPSPVVVGSEVIEIDKSSGMAIRGARGTTAKAHPANVAVTLFGYSSKLRTGEVRGTFGDLMVSFPYDRLMTGGGKILYKFGQNPLATVAGDKDNMGQTYIDDTQTDIGVNAADIMEFPDQGYIRIENEVIFYSDRSTGGVSGQGNAKFTGCERGQHGTVAVLHNTGRQVELWCVPVTDATNYPSPTILQVEEEWFAVQRDPTRGNFWISFVNAGVPVSLQRGLGVFGSAQTSHEPEENVLPTFLARESDPLVSRYNCQRNDTVTIMDATSARELARVRRSGPPPPPPPPAPPNEWTGAYTVMIGEARGQVVAFWDNVSRDYAADNQHARVLKFPSGELLGINYLEAENPLFRVGPLEATIDEIKHFGATKVRVALAAPIDSTATMIAVVGGNLLPGGGLLKVGREYIGYGRNDAGQLTIIKRGWLGSAADDHDEGDPVFYISFVPVASLEMDISDREREIRLNQLLAGQRNRYTAGYILIDEEVALFEWGNEEGNPVLGMPPLWDGTSGLFRGMFGTQAATHTADTALVYGLPWRFWDTYKPQEFDNRMAYYQWSTRMDLANWRTVEITYEVPEGDDKVKLVAVARLDGKGEWFDVPGPSDAALLWQNAGGAPTIKINRVGFLKDAGQFDLRLYVEYRPGSFDVQSPWTTASWKRTPLVKEIQVEYDRPTQTLFHEDR